MEKYKEVRDSRIDNWLAILRIMLNFSLFILAFFAMWQSPNDTLIGDVSFVVWIMTLLNLTDKK